MCCGDPSNHNLSEHQFGPGDFTYRTHSEGDPSPKESHQVGVGVFHPETGEGVGQITVGKSYDRNMRGNMAEDYNDAYTVGTVYVRPEFRGQGIAETMLNVANNTIGPGTHAKHSSQLSPAGAAFAERTAGHVRRKGWRTDTGPWSETPELHENVTGVTNGLGERHFASPTMQKVLGPEGRVSENAKYLTPAPPSTQETVKEPQMFRKVKGVETPVKKAMPK